MSEEDWLDGLIFAGVLVICVAGVIGWLFFIF
jgi:hypothetical protein